MSKLVKYFVYGGQSSFFEFDLDYTAASVSLRGSEVLYTGGAGVETVYAARGVSFDFTNASGQVDRLFLNASISDYSLGRQGTNLLLTENVGGSVIKVLAGSTFSFDRVVFLDGMASSKALYDAAGSGLTPGLDASIKTPANKSDLYASMGTLPEASIKAFAATNEGVTFGTAPKGGATLIATGGSGVDIVYVAAWSRVDAVDLSGGVDRIYLTGSFSDYVRSIQGTTLVLSRTEGSNTESVKINGGSTLAFDRVIFADGAARSVDLFNAAKNNTAPPTLDATLTTPGLAPALKANALSGVSDLDVRSNLVFQFTEDVTPQAGKFIRIVNDANSTTKTGLYAENTVNSFLIDATDSRVQIVNGRVTVNPDRDLDFANHYHIEIDAGAFVGKVTGKPNLAVTDPGALNFSTVTPGSDKSVSSSDGLSRIMLADGTLATSQVWKNIEGWPNAKTGGQTTLDLSDKKIALVTADLLPATSILDSSGAGGSVTNIATGDFNLRLSNFGADDLIYMDDLGRNNESPENPLQLIFDIQFNSSGGNSRFNFDAGPGKEGGAIEIVGQTFTDLAQWQQLIGSSQSPFIFGSVAAPVAPPDTTPPTLQSATVAANGRTITLVFSETLDAGSVTAAQMLSRFTVGVGQSNSVAIESVAVSGSQVVLTVPAASPIPSAASLGAGTVRLSYTDPSTGNETANVLQDAAGNDVASISNYTVVNNSTYTPPAPVTIQSLNASDTVSEGASITYTVTLSGAAPSGGFVVVWRVVAGNNTDPAEAQDFGTGASSSFPADSITIAAGQTTGQIVLPVFDDILPEGLEGFFLQVGANQLDTGPFVPLAQSFTSINPSDQSSDINGTEGNDTLNGTPAADVLNGLGGDDVLNGNEGNDTLDGGPGSDNLWGGEGNDRLLGGADRDTILPGPGVDTIDGGEGNDTLSLEDGAAPSRGAVINLKTGTIADDGYGNAETVINVENLHGTTLGDAITMRDDGGYVFGRAGADTIIGGNGGNFFVPGSGNDSILAGTGWDTVTYADDGYDTAGLQTRGVDVDLAAGTAIDNWGGSDKLSGVEHVDGSSLGDVIRGDAGNNRLTGNGGDDSLVGGAGSDSLEGGTGNDTLLGNLGNDVFYGGAGSDVMSGGEQRTLPWSTNLLPADFDRLEYAGSPGGITVDLSARTVVVAGQEGTDTYSGIEAIDGVANQQDVVTGRTSASATVLDGTSISLSLRGGNDIVNQTPLGYQQRWADGAFVQYNWSQTGIQAQATANNTIEVSYGAAGSQAAGKDTLRNIFGLSDSIHNDTFDLRALTITQYGYVTDQKSGTSTNLVFLGGSGNDTVQGNGFTFLFFNTGSSLNLDLTLSSVQLVTGTVTYSGVNGASGTALNDTLRGGINDDFEWFRGGSGDDLIDGRSGYDRADYRNANEGVTVNLAQGVATSASQGTDTLRSIEEIGGSQFADVIDARGFTGGGTSTTTNVGSTWWGLNAVIGNGGDDVIYGNGATRLSYFATMVGVRVNLAEGVADARLESDKSTLGYYSMGRDTFSGVYAVIGSSLDDELIGGGAGRTSTGVPVEVFTGGAGADTINGAGGEDIASYDSSPTGIVVDLSLSSGQVQDGWGFTDTLVSIEQIIGSYHADSMKGGAGNDTFEGRRGNDTVDGGAGHDEVSFAGETAGVTVRLGGWVGATGGLPSGFQGSALDGSGGIDVLKNVEGVEGSNYNDQIYGDAGDNRLDGRGGNDTIDGGAGIDWVEYNQAMRAVHVDLSQGKALDDGQGVGDAPQGDAVEQDTLLNIENVLGGFGADTIIGSAGDNVLEGGAGNDTINGGGGTDTARFTGTFANYVVGFEASGIRITDSVGGRDGADLLSNIERFVFSNGVYKVNEAGNALVLDDQAAPDTTPPTLAISAPYLQNGKILAGDYVTVNFTFSEAVTGFDAGDVVVSGGVLNNLFKSTDTLYIAGFQPTSGLDGTASFSVAAGGFSDAAGNASTAAASLSVTMRTAQPGNSGGTTFTEPATGTTSSINVRFSEPIFEKTAGASISGFSLALNPSATNDFQGTGTAPLITGFTLGEGSAADGYRLVTLQTNSTFGPGDVVRVSISGFSTNFRDADGNGLAAQDIHIGGSGTNTIDLGDNWFSSRQILRGNGGNDTLIGTDNADSLIDGGGADFIDPVWGGDSITLVENGGSVSAGGTAISYARDTIFIGFGDSRRGVGNTDFIGFDTSNSASGFDWFSSNSAAHDVLQLESGVIGTASSFAATPSAQGAITGHTISGGIVSFQGSSGAVTIRQDNTSLGNALDYLRNNLQAAGHTVAFKADYDNNGVAESLFVYQDMGKLPLADNAEMPDIVVRIAQPSDTAAARLASVTLGNAPGANVLEIQDGFDPEPAMVGLTANGVQLNFVEPMFAPTTASALGLSLKVNGTGTAYTPATVTGAGTSVITVQANGLAMNATDWALVTYSGSSSANALRDAAGKLLVPTDDNDNPLTSATFALGSSGNNTIDLSGYAVTGWGLDIEAGAGDDLVTGTASHDYIVGGTGADTLRGGAGEDSFQFEQGDSPVLTLNTSVATDAYMLTGATYTFAGGKVEVIENLAVGDEVWLSPPFEGVTGSPWLNFVGGTSAPGVNGLVTNQGYFGVRGTLGANGVFTVGTYNNGPDTLVVYDGDGSSGVSQTGFVLKGASMSDLNGFMPGYQPIRLRAPTVVNGTAGNDTLNGTYAADVINGLGGDDYLNGNEGNDTLDGGSGNDIAGYWSTWQSTPLNFTSTWRTSGGLQADGLGGTDTLINIEELHFGGGMGNDSLVGDTGRNYIDGFGGDDSITGGGGSDTFAFSYGQWTSLNGTGNDTITDFSGDDDLWFNNLSINSLVVGADPSSLMSGQASIVAGAAQTTLYIGADTVPGSDFSITLTGSFQASGFSSTITVYNGVNNTRISYANSGEFFVGTAGNDSRNGGAGDDTMEGREGNDSLTGMAGNDILRGEAGNDQLRGEDGNDTLEGGDGNDYMTGGLGNDSLNGGGGSGDTADYYFLGNPTGSLGPVTVNLTTGLATGGQGNDTLSGIENVNGTDGNDVITGDLNANRLEGRGGNDTLAGEAGNDSLYGGDGNDSLNGGLGADRFFLGQDAGSDTIDGGGYITRTPWPSFLTVPNNGDDYDRLVYTNAANGINLNMTTRTVTVNGLAGTDTYTNVEEVQGTTKTDTVVGKPSDGSSSFFFWGLGGSDVITQDTYGVGGRWTDGLQVGYSWSETGLTVNWTGNQATVAYGAGTGTLNSGAGSYTAGTDTLTNILYIQTSNYNDVVNGEGATLNHLGYLTNPFRDISYFIVAVRGGNDVIRGSGNFLLIPEVNTNAAAVPVSGLGVSVDGRTLGADGLLLMDMTHLKAPVSDTTAHGTVKFSGVSYVFGTPWADTVYAGNGIYDFRGQGGNDTFYGDENNNLSSYRSSSNGVSVNLAQGTVADLTGGTSSGTDTLRGVEMIEGTRFNDVFDAQGFSELSVNAGGTASFWKGMTNWYSPMGGNDTVTGNGYTRLLFTSAMMGIDANLAQGYVDALATDAATRASPEYLYTVGRTTFTGVNGVGGTDFADRLVGSNGGGAVGAVLAESFDPRGGDDTVDGQGGFDTVFYSSAPNAIQVNLTLATGQVVQDGWGSTDTLVNIERVEGSHWNDTFLGNDGDNSFRGLSGADTIDGGNGQDHVDYQYPRMSDSVGVIVDLGGTAVRSAGVLAATPAQLPAGFTGWARDNWGDIDFLKSIEGIGGSDWDDVLIGTDGNNRIQGWAGADTIDGAGGIDWAEYHIAEAGVTANLALGQATNDGSGFVDTLINIENLRGSIFNDSLVGNAGANQFKGEAGNDTINGGGGIDLATYVGARADYNVVFDNGVLTLTDGVSGRDGVDTVSEVERFDFAGVFYVLNQGQLVIDPL